MTVTMMLIITCSMKNIMMITKITSLTGMMPIISDMVTRMTLMTLMTRMVTIITGSLRHCVCSRRCSWKTSRWTAGPRPQQRWTAIITIIDLENLKAILIVNWVLVNLEKEVDEQNVEHILEWYENTVKNSLQLWDTVDCLERSEKQKEFLLQTFWIHYQLSYDN